MAKKFVKVTGLHNAFDTYTSSNSLDINALKSSVATQANENSILFITADATDASTHGIDPGSCFIWSKGQLFNQRQIPLIESSQSSDTSAWTGTCMYLPSLVDKQVIIYHLNRATDDSDVTLNLTLAGTNNTTGAKAVYYRGTKRLSTQVKQDDYVILVYNATADAWQVQRGILDAEELQDLSGHIYTPSLDSLAEGVRSDLANLNQATGIRSHAEGINTQAAGIGAHAEGYKYTTTNSFKVIGVTGTESDTHLIIRANRFTPIIGDWTETSQGPYAISNVQQIEDNYYSLELIQKDGTEILSDSNNIIPCYDGSYRFIKANIEGSASGTVSHAEGEGTQAAGRGAHAEGIGTIATIDGSHAEGRDTNASGKYSHAEGEGWFDREFPISVAGVTGTEEDPAKYLYKIPNLDSNWQNSDPDNLIGTVLISKAKVSGSSINIVQKITNVYHIGDEVWYEIEGNHNPTDSSIYYGIAYQKNSHVEGDRNVASGYASHAEGKLTRAIGPASHAEGKDTLASGNKSHAEGQYTIASGKKSHAEGSRTEASGEASHAEGQRTIASAADSHAEGDNTFASGGHSHAEGRGTNAEGPASHAEGSKTKASGEASHAEGSSTFAYSNYAHAEGEGSNARGFAAHVEGINTYAGYRGAHAEGHNTRALNEYSHAEGDNTDASGSYSHAEGRGTYTGAEASHAEGLHTEAGVGAIASHAEGRGTYTDGLAAHAEGCGQKLQDRPEDWDYNQSIVAKGDGAHAEGYSEIEFTEDSTRYGLILADGLGAHAEGYASVDHKILAIGDASHAEGVDTHALGRASHAEGYRTEASGQAAIYEHYDYPQNDIFVTSNSTSPNTATATYPNNIKVGDKIISDRWEEFSTYYKVTSVEVVNSTTVEFTVDEYIYGVKTAEDYQLFRHNVDPGRPAYNARIEAHSGDIEVDKGTFATHAEGDQTIAFGHASHSEGYFTGATGAASHAEGYHTVAGITGAHAEGRFNKPESDMISMIGIGTSESDRKNAVAVGSTGDVYVYGLGNYDGTNADNPQVLPLQRVIKDADTVIANTLIDHEERIEDLEQETQSAKYWADQPLQTGSSTQMSPRMANVYAGEIGGATGIRIGASYDSATNYSGGCHMIYDSSKACLQFIF